MASMEAQRGVFGVLHGPWISGIYYLLKLKFCISERGFLLFNGRVDKEDEMTCLIKGCNFVLKNIPHEAFVYAKHADSEFRFQTTHPDIFPYLLVNIGSGVSIFKVMSALKMFFFSVDQSVSPLWEHAAYIYLNTFGWGQNNVSSSSVT